MLCLEAGWLLQGVHEAVGQVWEGCCLEAFLERPVMRLGTAESVLMSGGHCELLQTLMSGLQPTRRSCWRS